MRAISEETRRVWCLQIHEHTRGQKSDSTERRTAPPPKQRSRPHIHYTDRKHHQAIL